MLQERKAQAPLSPPVANQTAAEEEPLRKVDQRLVEQLVNACHLLYMEGQNDINNGQASARVAGEVEFWLRGAALGFDEVGSEDFVRVGPDGVRLRGHRSVPAEWPIHSEIYLARPEVGAIIHTHAPAATLFGALGRELLPISHEGCPFYGRLGTFEETTNTILDVDTARALVDVLGDGPAVLLKNHGIVTVGGNLKEATVLALLLERACALQLRLPEGAAVSPSPEADVVEKNAFIFSHLSLATHWSYYNRKLARVRAGEQLPELRQI